MNSPPDNSPDRHIPAPPHPLQREEPLPWCSPKPDLDDSEASARVRTIMNSPTYIPADKDVGFLAGDETRGLRLELEYLKAESTMVARGIERTIVVFGGSRICEPLAARHRIERLDAALALSPDDKALRRRRLRAERLLDHSRYYDMAREFARLVATSGPWPNGRQPVIVTGGGPGIMEGANRGAFDAGAPTVGLNISLPHEQYPNPYITPDLCLKFHYFALRKLHFLLRARALVAFPGGFGTMDELMEMLTLVQTRKITPLPIVLIGESFWRKVFDADFLLAEGMIDPEDRNLFWFADSAVDAWRDILAWYEAAGRSLVD